MLKHLPESDWKKLRALHAIALERFCARIMDDISRVARDEERAFHDRYLDIYKLIKERDRDLAAAFDDLRRSRAIMQLGLIRSYGLLEPSELASFTPETQEAIRSLSERD